MLIENRENLGFCGGNNIGIRYALSQNPDYLLILNNDAVAEQSLIKELKAVVENQKAVIGVFITLEPPTGPMLTEAVTAGAFRRFHAQYPKIQIRTIQELLEGHGIEYPQSNPDLTFKKAERHNPAEEQLELM